MDAITEYFSDMPTAHRTLLLVGGLAIFFLIENLVPLFRTEYNKVKHTGLNIFFTLTTVLVNLLMAFILIGSCQWVTENNFGILQWMNASALVSITLGLMLMDFLAAWLAHYTEHHVKWMWQFHVIHHTDQHIDTTSGNRHHPGESIIRFGFTAAAIWIVGAPVWLIFVYQSVSLVTTQFSHSNINMPLWLDNILKLVFCTPNMHRVHHHYRQPYSDTNYGNIFSFWDRIFGTYVVVDNKKLVYGVDTYMDKKQTESIVELLKIPFQGYKQPIDYDKEEKL